uniref:Alpha-1,2-fucosyltransferase n=1 Tax=Panagrolaimus sp. PS1159 TaxID=55785 RepID=A0AC35GXQ1_9BILA
MIHLLCNLNPYNASKYIRIWGVYLQSWKYFEDYKSDIRKLLECSPILKEKAKIEAPNMWKNDSSSHKLCVHIRRGDFRQYRTFLETRADFLVPAIKYINNQIKAKTKKNTSLLIFGDDYNFIRSLKFPDMFTSINTFATIKNSSRGFEMCFAIEYCDTFLISASSSSFGWWIGYLLKSKGTVYYNAEIAKMKTFTKYMYAADAFPPHWKKLNVSKNGDVKEV